MNKLFKMLNSVSFTVKVFIISIVVYIVLHIIYYIYILKMKPKMESFGNPASCTYYYMHNCGHCKRFTPEWDNFVQSYTGPVRLRKVEMNDAGSDIEKYNIKGFPTVIMVDDNGETKQFDGPRTVEGLRAFVQA